MRILRAFLAVLSVWSLAACSPPPQPPAPSGAAPAESPAGSEYDPQQRARAVEDQTLEQFERQDKALEEQGG
jgi:hypothetical protein